MTPAAYVLPESYVSALKSRIASDAEVDGDEVWDEMFDDLNAEEQEAADGFNFSEAATGESTATQLTRFFWDSQMVSSFLHIEALHLGSTWFTVLVSDDTETVAVDYFDHLDAETATQSVERICRGGKYVTEALPDEVEVSELVDEARVRALFVDQS